MGPLDGVDWEDSKQRDSSEPSGVLLSHEVPVPAQTRAILHHNGHGIKTKVADGRRPAKIAVTGGGKKGQ